MRIIIPSAIAASLVLLPACRTRTFGDPRKSPSSAIKEDKPGVTPTTYDPKKLSGAELYRLTDEFVFSPKVHRVFIKMNKGTFDALHKDEQDAGCKGAEDPKWGHARYFVFDSVVFTNVALKVRGNTSRCIPRLQFGVKFDKKDGVFKKNGVFDSWEEVKYPEEVQDQIKKQNLYGLKALSLRRSNNDSTARDDSGNGMLAREYVAAWAMAQPEKVVASTARGGSVYRATYAVVEFQLCANDGDDNCDTRIYRIYNVTENIDKQFLKTRFDDDKGTLIQADKACGFRKGKEFTTRCYSVESFQGDDFDDKNAEHVAAVKGLLDGPQGLMTRMASVAAEPDAQKAQALFAETMDVNSVFNYAAGATTVGHWDSMLGNFNNDLVYLPSTPGAKWKMITWDLDNTFRSDMKGGPERDYSYDKVAGEERPLLDPVFKNALLAAEFKAHLTKFVKIVYDESGNGKINDKIIEARDQFVKEINDDLPPEERMDLARAEKVFDYKKKRYESLKTQLGL